MASDDMFESGSQRIGYGRSKSKEYTAEELAEMERRARKEGKRDIILSQLVEQQAQTTKTFSEIQTRLTEGDASIARLNEEHTQTLQAVRRIGEQASQATAAIREHMTQCDERWTYMKNQIDNANRALEKRTDSVKKATNNSIAQTVLANVISGVIVLVVVGGILAYVVLPQMIKSNSPAAASNGTTKSP